VLEGGPAAWREQIHGVCTQIRDQYLNYPGIPRARLSLAVGLDGQKKAQERGFNPFDILQFLPVT